MVDATDTATRTRPWIVRPCSRPVGGLVAFLTIIACSAASDASRGLAIDVASYIPLATMLALVVAYRREPAHRTG